MGRNSGSCKGLMRYLDKDENTNFFDKYGRNVSVEHAVKEIDNNVQKLTKIDDKYYMLSFNPSEYELSKMLGRKVDKFENLTADERTKLFAQLKEFTGEAMDVYAKNFNRPNVQDKNDLIYFARIETSRAFHHYEKEVREGNAKVGQRKDGLNIHIHVVVSRKSADGKVKLSPNMKFKNHKLEHMNTTRGFNYNDFTTLTHERFREMFNIQYNANSYHYTRDAKLISSRQIHGYAKARVQNIITQNQFQTERKMMSDSMKAIKFIKLATHSTNPITFAKETVKELIKRAQQIQQISMGMGR